MILRKNKYISDGDLKSISITLKGRLLSEDEVAWGESTGGLLITEHHPL